MIIKCWMRRKGGDVIKGKSRNGNAPKWRQIKGAMYNPPSAEKNEVLRIDNWYGTRRYAFYEEDHVNALPITKALQPDAWKPGDNENLNGDFLTSLIRRALQDEKSMRVIAIVTMLAALWAALVSTVGTYWIHNVVNFIGS